MKISKKKIDKKIYARKKTLENVLKKKIRKMKRHKIIVKTYGM
jgi:hypothetical protein